MKNQTVNTSVYRSFFEKEKLSGPNFIDWYCNLRIVLTAEYKLTFLEQPVPATLVSAKGQELPQQNLKHFGAYDMHKELKTMFPKQAEQELLQTVRAFRAFKQEKGQSVSLYVFKMKSYIDNLERLGHPMSLNRVVSLILISMSKEYVGIVQNYNMHGTRKTVNELHAMLKLHEETLPKKDVATTLHAIQSGRIQKNKNKKSLKVAKGKNQGKGETKLAYDPKPKIPLPPKKDNPAKDVICHKCGEGLRGNMKLKPGALNLYVGNGHRAAVEAIGTFYFCLPSGLVVVLNNRSKQSLIH
ncbi:hypothetical protein Tco_0218358 [Tanacetum coccineum]